MLGVERADGELNRPLSAKPVGRVAGVVALIVRAIGLYTDGQLLTVTDRHNAAVLLVFVEQVGHREVVERQSHASDDTRLAPSK